MKQEEFKREIRKDEFVEILGLTYSTVRKLEAELRVSTEERKTFEEIIKKLQCEENKNIIELDHLNTNRIKLQSAINDLNNRISQLKEENEQISMGYKREEHLVLQMEDQRMNTKDLVLRIQQETSLHSVDKENLSIQKKEISRDKAQLSKFKEKALQEKRNKETRIKVLSV